MSVNNSFVYTYNSLAGPGVPTGVTVKTVPTGVSVQALSCHTLKVTWLSPDHTGGLPITGYNISYTDTLNNNVLYEYSKTKSKSLDNLKPGTEYTVKVRAMNAIGEGYFTQERRGNTSQRRETVLDIYSFL